MARTHETMLSLILLMQGMFTQRCPRHININGVQIWSINKDTEEGKSISRPQKYSGQIQAKQVYPLCTTRDLLMALTYAR